MVGVATGSAAKYGLRGAIIGVNATAVAACLRTIRGRNFNKLSSVPRELVAQHARERRPSGVINTACKTSACFDHVADLKFLDHDGAVVIGVAVTECVQEMFTLATHFTVQSHYADLRLLSVFRSFLASRDDTLGMRETLRSNTQMTRRFDDSAVGVSHYVNYTAIDRDNRFLALRGRDNFKFAHDRCKPLITVAFDRASLRRAFELSMYDGTNWSDFRKVQYIAIEPPDLRMRFTQSGNITPLALPMGLARKFFKAALPCFIQFDEELDPDITRNVCKPKQFRAQFGQFICLVEDRQVDAITLWTRITNQTLFVGEVPEETKCVAPAVKPFSLLDRRVDSEAKYLVNDTEAEYNLVYGGRKRIPPRTARCLQTKCALGLRTKTSQTCDKLARFFDSSGGVRRCVQRFRMRTKRDWLRRRPRPFIGRISPEGRTFSARKLTQGSL